MPLPTGSRAYAAQNYVLSAEIFLPLAEQGDPRAQTYLGVMYLRGQGVPQNFRVAAYWLHLASEAGLPEAQYFLGLMYDKGQGVAQDFVLAHAWLNLAVAHAGPSLRSRWVLIRDAVASKMTEAQLAEARRLAYEWRPETPPFAQWVLIDPTLRIISSSTHFDDPLLARAADLGIVDLRGQGLPQNFRALASGLITGRSKGCSRRVQVLARVSKCNSTAAGATPADVGRSPTPCSACRAATARPLGQRIRDRVASNACASGRLDV